MNLLPIILILYSFLNQKNNKLDFSKLFENINLENFTPILNLFGVDNSIIEIISSDEFKNILKGNFNLNSIVKILIPIISSFMSKKNVNETEEKTKNNTYSKLTPIRDIADDNIYNSLDNYFNN